MKRTLIAAAGLALFAACGVASAASWSIVVEPGVYGRVAIGGYAQAPMVYEDAPVVVGNDGYVTEVDGYDQAIQYQEPVYLWVPDYQRLHWDRYCDQYGARGVPVYFVQDGWYRDNVMARQWTPAQRSWSGDQWLEQDRIARDRWERARWDREHWNRQPDDRQPAQWQGGRGAQWAPQPSWQSPPPWHGDPQRSAPQPRPQAQWHDDRGHAAQPWNGTPVRNDPGRGAYAPAQASFGAQQPGQWTRGGTRPMQPGQGSNQPTPAVWPHQPAAPARPVQAVYNPGQTVGRNAPHDGGERAGSQDRDDGHAQGNERGQYQSHPGGYQNR